MLKREEYTAFTTGFGPASGQLLALETATKFIQSVLSDTVKIAPETVTVMHKEGLGYMNNLTIHVKTLGYFSVSHCPTQCGCLIVHGMFVYELDRGKGLGQAFLNLAEEIAAAAGYSTLMCTVIIESFNKTDVSRIRLETRNHLLDKFGYQKVHEFKNKRTRNGIGVFFKTIE